MALTKKELHLLRAITLSVFKNKWDKREFVKENVMARAKALEDLYKSSPQRLISMINLYNEELSNEEVNETYVEILELFQEMRTGILIE